MASAVVRTGLARIHSAPLRRVPAESNRRLQRAKPIFLGADFLLPRGPVLNPLPISAQLPVRPDTGPALRRGDAERVHAAAAREQLDTSGEANP